MPIVETVGAASGMRAGKVVSLKIQQAMAYAAAECQAEGVTDPNVIRERMQAARQAVKDAIAAAQAANAAEG